MLKQIADKSREPSRIFLLLFCMWIVTNSATFFRRGQLKCDGTRAEARFRLSAKRTSPFQSAEASVQSTTGNRGVLISGSNAGYTMFRGRLKVTGYPLHSPVPPFTSPAVRYRMPSPFNWSLTPKGKQLFGRL